MLKRVIGWDSNELSLDGYEPSIGFIHVDLRPLQSMKITYGERKPLHKGKVKMISMRSTRLGRNRARDLKNKLAAGLRRIFLTSVVNLIPELGG